MAINKDNLRKNTIIIFSVIIFGVITILLAVSAIVLAQFLPVPSQLKFALGFIFAMFVSWLGFLKTYHFIEKKLIKSRS